MATDKEMSAFVMALHVGMGAAACVAERAGQMTAARLIHEYAADWKRKVDANMVKRGPREMVAGDIFMLVPLMTAADLGLSA